VSGLLVSEDRSTIFADSNGVIQHVGGGEWMVLDATNHAEQRLIYWYWANRTRLSLPEPHQLTIITTLDPCIMCSASIMLSGFNVGTITLDDYGGANYNRNGFEDYCFAP
jgi:tRNA(Arg) A34 adenosine deaminase TadA